MTTKSQSTVGSTMYVLDKSVSPPVVIAVPQMKGADNVGGGSRKKIDISNFDSKGYNELAGGRADPPELGGEMVLDKTNTGHQKLKALFEAQAGGSVANIDVWIGDGDATTAPTVVTGVLVPPQSASPKKWTRSGTLGLGYISKFVPKKVDDDVDRCSFSFQFSGKSTWNVKGEIIAKTY